MFAGILRIGPFVILEGILLCSAGAIYFLAALAQCYIYTLTELGFVFFLIEMFTSLNIMKKSPQMRKKYIKERIQQEKWIFYGRMAWDNINIMVVILLLYSALVLDGLQLTATVKTVNPNTYTNNNQQCEYTLFSICLFADLINQCFFDVQDSMIVWMLYAASTFLISVLCILVGKEYYQYCLSLTQNRRLSQQYGEMNETLLNCSVYRIRESTTINQELREELGICSICMHELIGCDEVGDSGKIIKLACKHHFHQECIHKWLKVKDHCPYRCFMDQK